MATTFLPVLTQVEKQSLHERQPLPDAFLGLSDEEMDVRIAAASWAIDWSSWVIIISATR
jgi:hypothetical protein